MMEAKLAELEKYRAKKKSERKAEERNQRVWQWFSFRKSQDIDHEEEDGDDQPNSWTRLDYAIVCVKALIVLIGQMLSIQVGFGAVYFATSCFALIWLNLGTKRRKKGEMSAYSVFNADCQSIQGTLTAEKMEKEMHLRR